MNDNLSAYEPELAPEEWSDQDRWLLAPFATNPDGSPIFPVVLRPNLYIRATLTATLTGLFAAVIPARNASRLDPAVTIRNG